jgi:hypothetical protein
MQSSKFVNLAKKIVKRDPEVFETLMEFEKTKRMRTKTRLNFTIDNSVTVKFKKYCRDHGYNMSAKVEQMMREMVS